MDNLKKWAGVFLLRSVDTSFREAINLVNDLRKIDFGESISMVLCLNVVKSKLPILLAGNPDLLLVQPPGGDESFTTVFYSLERNKTPAPSASPAPPASSTGSSPGTTPGHFIPSSAPVLNDLVEITRKDDFDIGNPDDIQTFFKNEVMDKRVAERYALFTWDHGNGYNIFKQVSAEEEPEKLTTISFLLPDTKASSGIKALTMDELAKAITGVFPSHKLDLLVMMNCGMQSFDAGYALRNAVQYLVAPETNMDFSGYNYWFFFRRLVEDPRMPTLELVKHVIDSFRTTLYEFPATGVQARSTTALFAMDLSHYDQMADGIDLVAAALEVKLANFLPEIQMARGITLPINSGVASVDFFFLLENLGRTLGAGWEVHLRQTLRALRDRMIVGSYVGSAFAQHVESPGPSGFSVFFNLLLDGEPPAAILVQAMDIIRDGSFFKEREWNKLILRLNTRTPG